mmetsp:Transcript_34673/g.104697  ORF Transcript_34673/g.104697 Transcript_34673/m.104697 type:complete len:272 (-) Transcript_34673:684-1499(-)
MHASRTALHKPEVFWGHARKALTQSWNRPWLVKVLKRAIWRAPSPARATTLPRTPWRPVRSAASATNHSVCASMVTSLAPARSEYKRSTISSASGSSNLPPLAKSWMSPSTTSCGVAAPGKRAAAASAKVRSSKREAQLSVASNTSRPAQPAAAASSKALNAACAVPAARTSAACAPQLSSTPRSAASWRTFAKLDLSSKLAHSLSKEATVHGTNIPRPCNSSNNLGKLLFSVEKRTSWMNNCPWATDGDCDFHAMAKVGNLANAASASAA